MGKVKSIISDIIKKSSFYLMQKIKNQLSIILPTYNESENIIPLIEEIMNKLSRIPFEILVIDDNSPDKTGFIVKNKLFGQKNIRVFIRSERGLAGAILF